ncbi:putative F-box domain-containing protein [Helianthus anomalus]
MSDHIPFEIQSEIMKTVPVKSLIRFQSVCKSWKSLIHSSDFIAHYTGQQQHLLVRYKNRDDFKEEYVSLVDDDSFPQHRVCTTDPKIVTITPSESLNPWQVEVFTLSTRAWRSPYSTNLPSKSVNFFGLPVVVDGCLYWLTWDYVAFTTCGLIISFDMTSEEFGEVNLPDGLAHHECNLSMDKLRESLVVVEVCHEANKLVYNVWMMKDGVPKSFQKLYTISTHPPDVLIQRVMGFRKTGEPLIVLQTHLGSANNILAAYEPYSKSINNLGINERKTIYYNVYSCMETLILL